MNIRAIYNRVAAGETVKCRPKGNSMVGRINSGQLVTIKPASVAKENDIVLCKVKGNYYIHLVSAIGSDGRYQISNNHGYINGWTSNIVGIVTNVES